MSNSIWKTTDLENAVLDKQILFYAGGSSFPYLGWHYPQKGFGTWDYKDIQKWAYLSDVLAQADKAERLQKGLEDIKNQLEYRACLECKHCNQQLNAIEILKDVEPLIKGELMTSKSCCDKAIDEIKQLIK